MSVNVKNGFFPSIIKGTLVSVCVLLAGVLLFALVYSFAGFNNSVVKPVNQVIKVLAVFIGVIKVRGERGLLRGAIVGAASITLSYLLFALISGSNLFGTGFFSTFFSGWLPAGFRALSRQT